jgi:DNA-directed RNA polymerase subunit RPC12/RpoP
MMAVICQECGNTMKVIDDGKNFFIECKNCSELPFVKASSFVTAKFMEEWA